MRRPCLKRVRSTRPRCPAVSNMGEAAVRPFGGTIVEYVEGPVFATRARQEKLLLVPRIERPVQRARSPPKSPAYTAKRRQPDRGRAPVTRSIRCRCDHTNAPKRMGGAGGREGARTKPNNDTESA